MQEEKCWEHWAHDAASSAGSDGVKNVPFCPRRNSPGFSVLVGLVIAIGCDAAIAEDNANTGGGARFMKLSAEQRYWWIEGAILTTAHLAATHDRAKGACISGWYTKDERGRQQLIEQAIVKYPAELPTTIVLGLLTQACGQLLPK